jgi:hypothetical protein
MRPHTSPPSGTSSPGFSQVTHNDSAPLDKCSLNAVDPDISLCEVKFDIEIRECFSNMLRATVIRRDVSVQTIDLR